MTRVLDDFEGAWRIERRITHANGLTGVFSGNATWTRSENGMDYLERGELRFGDNSAMQAERRYLWRDDLSVWFADGRFFHHVPADGGDTSHWCDPDQYDVTYDFSDWPTFTVSWCVKGPAKDYKMISYYARTDEGTSSPKAI